MINRQSVETYDMNIAIYSDIGFRVRWYVNNFGTDRKHVNRVLQIL